MSIGKRIQAAREARGLSRRELAQLLDTTRMTVYRVEKDAVSLRTVQLEQWAKVLKTSSSELVS